MSITAALSALATKLAAVAPVRTGRAALETTSATLPVLTLLSQTDLPAVEQMYGAPAYTRRLIAEYKCTADDQYPAQWNVALTALRAALAPDADGQWLGGHALDLRASSASFFHPADNGTDCYLQLGIEIDYLA